MSLGEFTGFGPGLGFHSKQFEVGTKVKVRKLGVGNFVEEAQGAKICAQPRCIIVDHVIGGIEVKVRIGHKLVMSKFCKDLLDFT